MLMPERGGDDGGVLDDIVFLGEGVFFKRFGQLKVVMTNLIIMICIRKYMKYGCCLFNRLSLNIKLMYKKKYGSVCLLDGTRGVFWKGNAMGRKAP